MSIGRLAQSSVSGNDIFPEVRQGSKSRMSDFSIEERQNTSESTSIDFGIQGDRISPATRQTNHKPSSKADTQSTYQEYRMICDSLLLEISRADDYLVNNLLVDEGMEVVVEVEHLLNQMYRCDWGRHECLKRIVIAIRTQINNVQWTASHVSFVKNVVHSLRVRYLVDDALVNDCYDLMTEHGFDPFRGTVAESAVRTRYRIVEAE